MDLNDGKLVKQKQSFDNRVRCAEGIGVAGHSSVEQINCDLKAAAQDLEKDLKFIHSGKLSELVKHTVITVVNSL